MILPQKHHIILKKHKGANTLWIAEEYLIQATGVSYDYLMKKRHITKAWVFKTINTIRYYNFNTIPNRKPTYYRSKLPSIDEMLNVIENPSSKVSDYDSYFNNALQNYTAYSYLYPGIEQDKQIKLCKAVSILAETIHYINETGYNTKKYQLFDELSALISEHQISYFPANRRRIKEKVLFACGGTPLNELISLPRAGNCNAAIYQNDTQIENWVYQLASNPKNYSDSYICRKIIELCSIQNRPTPSSETIRQKLINRETRFLTSVIRHGAGTRDAAAYEGTIPIGTAPFAGDCWQLDATRVNMIGHERIVIDKNGKKTKTLANVMVCAVRDVHSGECLGYSFDYAENHIMTANAIKMSVQTAGYLPYELVMDRYPGHNSNEGIALKETLETMGVKITITHKPTGKGAMERWFNTMQQIEMQGSDYYYGEGIKSKRKAAHVSPDYLAAIKKKAKKEGYDLRDTVQEYAEMIETHNNRLFSTYSRKHRNLKKSPHTLHAESDKPNVILVKESHINHLFGVKTDVKVAANGIIEFKFRNIKHHYLIEDYDIIQNNAKVCVSYNPEDMDSVGIYSRIEGSTWLKRLCTAKQFTPINIYGPQAEFNRLNKMKQHQRNIEETRKAKLNEKLDNEPDECEVQHDFERFEAEEEMLMGMHTCKKAANGYEDIELNEEESAKQSIYNQLYKN